MDDALDIYLRIHPTLTGDFDELFFALVREFRPLSEGGVYLSLITDTIASIMHELANREPKISPSPNFQYWTLHLGQGIPHTVFSPDTIPPRFSAQNEFIAEDPMAGTFVFLVALMFHISSGFPVISRELGGFSLDAIEAHYSDTMFNALATRNTPEPLFQDPRNRATLFSRLIVPDESKK
jgi:hypothetical protein